MATIARYFAPLALLPLFAFTGNKPATPDLPKAFRDKFASVPAGVLKTDADEVRVGGFMISATEVSNGDYMAFVDALRASGNEAALKVAMPDPKQWAQVGAGVEPYETHYYTHPAYTNYPVVNVSREGALAYCQWLQNELNKEAGAAKYEVRLPSRTEWWYAANGGHHKATYAWGGPALRNVKGCTLANYRQVGDENVRRDPVSGNVLVVVEHPVNLMGVAGSYSDNAAITAPVHAYSPNDFGLYNMNGNVAEMLAERRERWGYSYHVLPGDRAHDFAPLVADLTGT